MSPKKPSNILIKLLELYPNEPWDYTFLSDNPNITLEYVESRTDISWSCWDYLGRNPGINLDDILNFIRKYPNKSWNWYRVSENPTITMSDILKNPDISWSYDSISAYGNITMFDFRKHENLFNSEEEDYILNIFYNKHNTLKDTLKYLKDNDPNNFKNIYTSLLRHMSLSELREIFIIPDLDFDKYAYNELSRNPNITLKFIQEFKLLDWSWHLIAEFANITLTDILNTPDCVWFKYSDNKFEDALLKNPNITLRDIQNNIETLKKYNLYNILDNPNINLKIINETLSIITDPNERRTAFRQLSLNNFNFFKKRSLKMLKILDVLLPHELSMIVSSLIIY